MPGIEDLHAGTARQDRAGRRRRRVEGRPPPGNHGGARQDGAPGSAPAVRPAEFSTGHGPGAGRGEGRSRGAPHSMAENAARATLHATHARRETERGLLVARPPARLCPTVSAKRTAPTHIGISATSSPNFRSRRAERIICA